MEKKNKPEIRFKGFKDDWEDQELGKVAKFNPKHEIPDFFNYVDLESVVGTQMISFRREDKLTAPSRAQRLAEKGDVFYQTVRPYQKNNLLFDREDNNFVFSTGYAQLRPIIESDFLFTLIQKDEFVKIVLNNCTGTSYPAINSTVLASLKQYFPKNKTEQQKIGNFFEKLDQLITQHQQKHSKLKAIKKAMLDKMFPKQGHLVPEIRFKGFEGDWEEKKLGDLADIVRGASPRPINDPKWFDKNSEIGWLRISDVTEQNGRINYLEQRISKMAEEQTRVLDKPHLLLSIAASVGKPLINYVKTGVHDGFIIFLNPKFNLEFMFHWMKMFEYQWQKYGQPGSQVNLNSEIVKNQKLNIPNEKEQTKIGNYFKNLDELIANHETQITKLQNIKKAFLAKMFI